MKFPSREDPFELARKVCEFHATNTGPPLSHQEVLADKLGAGEPEARGKALALVKLWTSEGGEFHWLMLEKKFAMSHKPTAQAFGMPYRRFRGEVTNHMEMADQQRKSINAQKYTPEAIKVRQTAMANLFEKFAGRHFGVARYYEARERQNEQDATINSEFRAMLVEIQMLRRENANLWRSQLTWMGGKPTTTEDDPGDEEDRGLGK
jgi:hypothetical protein